METIQHSQELATLLELGDWVFRDQPDVFFAGNISIFYMPEQISGRNRFRSPDFFLVLGTERRPRNSWVVWQEGGRYPDLIIELLSRGTRKNDLGPKKEIYQDVFRTPEYYAFDPLKGTLLGFELIEGRYHDRTPDARGLLWSEAMGHYLGVRDGRLRLFTRDGEMVPTGRERGLLAEAEQQRADAEERRAEAEQQRAEAERRRAEAERRRAEAERRCAEAERRRAEVEQQRAEVEQQRADAEERRAEAAEQRAETAEQRAETAEQQAKRLMEQLRQLGIQPD